MDISDYSFYRYLGEAKMISNGVSMQPRDVYGLVEATSDTYYIAHPKYDNALAISASDGEMIKATSRPFTARPDSLFQNVDFTPYEEKKKSVAPAPKSEPDAPPPPPAPAPAPKPTPAPAPKPAMPILKRPDENTMQPTLPPEFDNDPEMDTAARRAAAARMMDMKPFGKIEPLIYANAIYPGGTANDYAVKPVTRCGKVHLEVLGMDEMRVPGVNLQKNGISPPDYVLKDIQENVMPGIGLNYELPFKRLYVGLLKANSDSGGSHIATYQVHGFLYGAISIHPNQLVQLLGGYNSLSMAHVITHELAHFVDHTMLRNVDRMKFDTAIRGKKIHPDSLDARTIKTVPAEHFATLAELMVWGYSLRNVYSLNGVEVVAKYFENRYIPQADIDSRKI